MQNEVKFQARSHRNKEQDQLPMFPKQPDFSLYTRNKMSSSCPLLTSFSPPPLLHEIVARQA